MIRRHRREMGCVRQPLEEAIALSNEKDFPFWVADGMIQLGRQLIEEEAKEEGLAQILHGLTAFQATGAELALPQFLSFLAEAYEKTAKVEEALCTLDEALAVVDNNEERMYEAELYRLKGELSLAPAVDDHAQAEACFHQALTIARRQHAKSWELRAATCLARLWQSQDKCQDAYDPACSGV